jgi:hypothetical protein
MTDASSPVVLLHGGSVSRRAILADAIRTARGGDVRVRMSSRAAEAAKCLADPSVIAVFFVDAPDDATAVRARILQQQLDTDEYQLEPRDTGDVVVSLVRESLRRRTR